MKKVEIRPAYEWTCDNCGCDQFERAIIAELTPDEIREIQDQMDIDDPAEFESGQWQLAPVDVKCKNCGAEYETVDPQGEENESV